MKTELIKVSWEEHGSGGDVLEGAREPAGELALSWTSKDVDKKARRSQVWKEKLSFV